MPDLTDVSRLSQGVPRKNITVAQIFIAGKQKYQTCCEIFVSDSISPVSPCTLLWSQKGLRAQGGGCYHEIGTRERTNEFHKLWCQTKTLN